MLRFESTETASISNCGIIEGVTYEDGREEETVSFILGSSKYGNIGLEVDKGPICIQVSKFFDKIISMYATRTEGPKTEVKFSNREVIAVQWSISSNLVKSIGESLSDEERTKRYQEIDSKAHELVYKVLEEVKKEIGLS